ncbi:sulfite exporter TauE/SafE family protein [Caldimonas tepidiphila]|uniref:sulfite exporter TauE/SafE family protein n=1 Tax=Caldimonas tepidiphila TaxID=2315841 RepID=UPI000E5A1307|nr:TSUP family transporter [Caldimonas tepidiphila]
MTELLLLVPIAFLAGVANAIVGGGGLMVVPGLFSAYPGALPATLLGTDKAASVPGHGMAIAQYARRIELPWRLLAPSAAAALVGAYAGATCAHLMPTAWMRPLVIALASLMLVYTALNPKMGAQDQAGPVTGRTRALGMLLGGAIGFYDGFFGPGAGTFLLFLFVKVFRFDFLRAAACSKVLNMTTNVAALSFFLPNGHVAWGAAVPMGAAAIAGSVLGTRIALRGGSSRVRFFFLGISTLLLAKMVADLLRD